MSFLSRIFPKRDPFSDVEKQIERLKAKGDTEGLISLMQEVQHRTSPSEKWENIQVFIQQRRSAVYQVALALAEQGDPQAVEPVIDSLKDQLAYETRDWTSPSPQILAKFGAVAVEPLITRLEKQEGDYMRDLATSALGLIGEKRAIDPLLKLAELHLRNQLFPRTTAWALGNFGEEPKVAETLVEALYTGSGLRGSEGAAEALFALSSGKFGKLAEEILLQHLGKEGGDNVARALCALGNRQGMEALMKNQTEYSPSIDLVFLGRFKTQRIKGRIEGYLGSHPHDTDWAIAVLALAELGETDSVKPLVEVLATPRLQRTSVMPWYRQSVHDLALQALRKLGAPATHELSRLTKHSDPEIRTQAEKTLQLLQVESDV